MYSPCNLISTYGRHQKSSYYTVSITNNYKKKKILVALGMVFSLGLQEGNLFKSFTDVMYAIAIYHLSKMQWIDL